MTIALTIGFIVGLPAAAGGRLQSSGAEGGTTRQGTAAVAMAGSVGSGASLRHEVGAGHARALAVCCSRAPKLETATPADQPTYWQRLAAKRLRIIGKRERTIVRLMVTIHKLRASVGLERRRPGRTGETGSPAHIRGWLCIHSREGAWNANTGNGFYGGLQMTYGWMGLVRRADLLSPAQQMQAAETGYRRSGYSDSWMRGQWPRTYPPCARLF